MKSVQILEAHDVLTGDEYVRAIDFVEHDNAGCNQFSTYGGRPENNTLWVPFRDVFGVFWIGKTVAQLQNKLNDYRHEFILGEPPVKHIWVNWREQRRKEMGE